MGRLAILWGLSLLALANADWPICSARFCHCTFADHPLWIKLSCTLDYQSQMVFAQNSVPEHATDVEVFAATKVVIGRYAFNTSRYLRRLTIKNSNVVYFVDNGFHGVASPSLLVQVFSSDYVDFESQAFPDNKTALSLLLEGCAEVAIAHHVFKNVNDVTLKRIPKLKLAEGAFHVDNRAIVSHHGPELIIEWEDVYADRLPKDTFGSSAARITLRGVTARTIAKDAFSANTINKLEIDNCKFDVIDSGAFNARVFIHRFTIIHSTIDDIKSKAINIGISGLVIEASTLSIIRYGAIDISAATVEFYNNKFGHCDAGSIQINKYSNFTLARNTFTSMEPLAIDVNPVNNQFPSSILFVHNNMTQLNKPNVPFVNHSSIMIIAHNNYYGLCHCDMRTWMSKSELSTSFCQVSEFLEKCYPIFNFRTVNIQKFINDGCTKDFKPQKCTEIEPVVDKNVSVPLDWVEFYFMPAILIIVASFFGFLVFTCSSKSRRSKYGLCYRRVKTTCRGLFLLPLCFNRSNCEIEAAGSISQLATPHDYTEMHCLNAPRRGLQTPLPQMYAEILTADKATQSLPEELTHEFLEGLKERLDDPESYEDAKAIVDHLYELVKAEETCNSETARNDDENIYDLPLPPPIRMSGKKKECVSVGTDAPSLENLLPSSPYDRQTSLCHEYFEPRDVAVHVYAEISNYHRSSMRNALKSCVPDVVAGQAMPRGPFLRALQQKASPRVAEDLFEASSTVRSTGSAASDVSGKMINRPLPAEPKAFDPVGSASTNLKA